MVFRASKLFTRNTWSRAGLDAMVLSSSRCFGLSKASPTCYQGIEAKSDTIGGQQSHPAKKILQEKNLKQYLSNEGMHQKAPGTGPPSIVKRVMHCMGHSVKGVIRNWNPAFGPFAVPCLLVWSWPLPEYKESSSLWSGSLLAKPSTDDDTFSYVIQGTVVVWLYWWSQFFTPAYIQAFAPKTLLYPLTHGRVICPTYPRVQPWVVRISIGNGYYHTWCRQRLQKALATFPFALLFLCLHREDMPRLAHRRITQGAVEPRYPSCCSHASPANSPKWQPSEMKRAQPRSAGLLNNFQMDTDVRGSRSKPEKLPSWTTDSFIFLKTEF